MKEQKYLYQFVGGNLHNKLLNYSELEEKNLIDGYNADLSKLRAKGILVYRAELDNQPFIDGYLSPMYDGVRYEVNGHLKYDFKCTEEEKANKEPIHIIRYETQEIYDLMSY